MAKTQISDDTIEVSVKYGKKYCFNLREVTLAEEQKLRSKSFGLTDEKAAAKEYELNVSILRDLSVKAPMAVDGDTSETFEVDAFFAERTPRKERIAFFAVRGYFARLMPEEDF